MKKIAIVLIILFVATVGLMIYKKITTPDIPNVVKEMDESLNIVKEEQDTVNRNWSDSPVSKEFVDYLNERYSKPESAVEYLFAVAMLNQEDFYPDAFTLEQYNEDVFGNEETNKIKLVTDIMNRLSRNQTLESVEMIKSMMVFEKDSLRVVADLNYSDLEEPIRINVKLKKLEQHSEDEHIHEHGSNYYYIDSSVWDILGSIEGGE